MALAIILTILVARDKIKNVAAIKLIEKTHFQLDTFMRYDDLGSSKLCEVADKDVLFIAIYGENIINHCASKEFKDINIKEFLKRFDELGNKEFSILFSKRLNNDFLFYKTKINVEDLEYRVYVVLKADKIFNFLLEINNSILIYIFPIFIISTLISLLGAMKMANPVRSILSKIINFSKIYNKDNLLFEIQNSQGSEWEIIERSIDESEYINKKLLSNLKKESKKFETLLGSISDSIIAINKKGEFLFANSAFIDTFTTADKDHPPQELIEVIRDYDLKQFIEKSFNNIDEEQMTEICLTDEFNIKKYYLISSNPLRDSNSQNYGLVCIFHDVTSIKMAEKMRSDFVANVSHEIRTPLTAIKGYSQTLESIIETKAENKEIFDTIVHNCDRLTSLFNDLLSLTTIEAINEIQLFEVDAEEVTEQAILACKQNYFDTKVEIKTNYNIHKIVSNDQMLEQIMINLISNAIKYSERDLILNIDWREEADHYQLIIKDNGPGMAKEHLPRIFERFYRIDHSRNRKYGGTGLGLAIVKHLVSKLGGKIRVESELNVGTTFIIKLMKLSLH